MSRTYRRKDCFDRREQFFRFVLPSFKKRDNTWWRRLFDVPAIKKWSNRKMRQTQKLALLLDRECGVRWKDGRMWDWHSIF